MDAKINELVTAMITLYHDDPKRIHHFMKVYAFASAIAQFLSPNSLDIFVLSVPIQSSPKYPASESSLNSFRTSSIFSLSAKVALFVLPPTMPSFLPVRSELTTTVCQSQFFVVRWGHDKTATIVQFRFACL